MPRTRAGAANRSGTHDRYVIEAADRALMLLELLAQHPDLGVTEIAERMDVSKTLAFRLLHTLERRDFVVRDSTRRTSALGYKLLHLAEKVESHSLIVGATKSLMDELGTLCDEDVNLFVRLGTNSLCLAARPSVHQVRVYPQVGLRLHLHAGGASPLLLAHAPEEVREAVLAGELKKLTPVTLTDPVKLRQRLDRIRRDGFHISRGDVDRGASSRQCASPARSAGSPRRRWSTID
jgi:IclR family KDG regulon transcriptional repressor